MTLIPATDALASEEPVSPISLGAATPAQALPANTERNGAQLSADSANTAPVYVLLGTGTPSATNWHLCLPAGASVAVEVGGVVWRGAVQLFCSATAKVGVAEA